MGANCTKAGEAASPQKSRSIELEKPGAPEQKPIIDVKDLSPIVGDKPAEIVQDEKLKLIDTTDGANEAGKEIVSEATKIGNGLIIEDKEQPLELKPQTALGGPIELGSGLISPEKKDAEVKEVKLDDERKEIIRKSYESVARMANNGEVYIIEEEEPEVNGIHKP